MGQSRSKSCLVGCLGHNQAVHGCYVENVVRVHICKKSPSKEVLHSPAVRLGSIQEILAPSACSQAAGGMCVLLCGEMGPHFLGTGLSSSHSHFPAVWTKVVFLQPLSTVQV